MSATTVQSLDRVGALRTVVEGVKLSPELREGLGPTLALAFVATASRAVVPIAVQQTIDNGVGDAGVDLAAVRTAVIAAGVAVLVTAVASSLMNVRLARVTERALASLRRDTFRHIHDLSMLHQAAQQRGSLVARVTSDIDEISRFMQWGGLNLITATGQVTIATVVMLVYSWRLTLVVLLSFVPFTLVARAVQRRLTAAYGLVRERVGTMLGAIAEAVVGAPVVRAYGIENRTERRLGEAIADHRRAAIRAGRLSALFSASGEFFGSAATAVAVVVGVLLGVDGTVTPGTVVLFFFLINLFIEPLQLAAEVVNEAQTAVAGWRRVLDVLDVEPDVADPGERGRDLPEGPIAIAFRGVRFRYPRGPEVLHGIDVEIPARQRVAVVGETGSGKTTFAKLLTRLMDPVEGTVALSGVPTDEVRFDSLRRRVVMVPQEGSLFDGTITSNIHQGRPQATEDDLRLAILELGLSDWIDELPQGLDTPVGERGAGLSAGERQLVALARAYLANPDLLVLDEATSAVDPATEVRLQRALAGLTTGRTTVTIAHRLSTAETADRVLVFDSGDLVQDGAHDELVAQGGVYGRLYASWRRGATAA